MRLKNSLLIFMMLSGCSVQLPNYQSDIKPSANSSATVATNNQANSTVTNSSVSPEIKQSGNPDTVTSSSSLNVDSKLDSKDAAIGGSVQPSISPNSSQSNNTSTSQGVLITSPQQSSGSTGNSGPIKDSDRGQGHPATPCDGVDPNSKQCLDYLQSQKPSPPPYSNNYAVEPADVRDGSFTLIFKDEYKVRVNFGSDGNVVKTGPVFYSKTGENLDYINQIVDKYDLRNSFGIVGVDSEELASRDEKVEENNCSCDSPNILSINRFNVKNKNIKEIIESLRLSPLVRESNYIFYKFET